jgi:uncharacterized protein (DUF2062 family)
MPRRFFTSISARFKQKRDHPWYLKPFDYIITHPVYFSATRRSVGGGLWIGLFVGLLPIPGQTIVAVLAALWLRVNIPVAAITIWITNPITFVPIFYLSYRIGALILNIPTESVPAEFTLDWVSQELALRWRPLALGSLIMALSVSSIAYLLVSAIWHVSTIKRYRRRHSRNVGSIHGGKGKRTNSDQTVDRP